MPIDYEELAKSVSTLPEIAKGSEFPEGACTTYIITNGHVFFNTHGQGWRVAQSDLGRRFAPAYKAPLWDGEWMICYSQHGMGEELVDHLSQHPGISDHAAKDIVKLLASDDPALQQVGALFYRYAAENDQNRIIPAQNRRHAGLGGLVRRHVMNG